MRHVTVEMVTAGIRALKPYRRQAAGAVAIDGERVAEALAAAFRAMLAAGAGRDKSAAERQRRHRAKLKQLAGES